MRPISRVVLAVVAGLMCCSAAADPIQDYLEHQMATGWPMHGEVYSGGSLPQVTGPSFTQQIEEARQSYWKAYRSGEGKEDAAQKFGTMLAQKDLYCLWFAIMFKEGSAMQRLFGALGEVDGGIPLGARWEFSNWFQAIKERTSGKVISDPRDAWKIVADAIAKAEPQRQMYVVARDFAEFDRAGIQLPPKAYALMFVLRFPDPKTTEEASRVYQDLVATFGEERILELAAIISKAPISAGGTVINSEAFGVTTGKGKQFARGERNWQNSDPVPDGLEVIDGARDRWQIFRHKLLSSQPRGYLLRLLLDREHPKSLDLSLVRPTLDRLLVAYGEATVNKATETVRKATKRMEEGWLREPQAIGAHAHNPSTAIHEVLARLDLKGHARFLLAEHQTLNSPEQINAAYAATAKKAGGEEAMLKAMQAIQTFWDTPMHERRAGYQNLRFTPDANFMLLTEVLESGPASIVADHTMLASPDYVYWAGYKPGAMIVVENVYKRTTTQKSDGKVASSVGEAQVHQYVLKTITSENVILTYSNGRRPQGGRTMWTMTWDLPAPAKVLKTTFESEIRNLLINLIQLPRNFESGLRGTEKVTTAGREYTCKLYVHNLTTPQTAELKVWLSDEAPGGLVLAQQLRTYENAKERYADTQEYRLVEVRLDAAAAGAVKAAPATPSAPARTSGPRRDSGPRRSR